MPAKLCLNMIVKNEGVRTHPVLSLLTPYDVPGFTKKRFGAKMDGGYVLLDDLADVHVVYSIGVGSAEVAGAGAVTFDKALAETGRVVYMFDHTVDAPPEDHIRFVFDKIGVSDKNETTNAGARMYTLDRLIDKYFQGNNNNMILKMDVEGAEWDVLSTVSRDTLRHFRQMVIEVHGLTKMSDPFLRAQMITALTHINEEFTLFHVHANNTAAVTNVEGFRVADVMELSYVRSDLVASVKSHTVYPTEFDAPCWPPSPDVKLDFYPFYNPQPRIIRCLESVAPWISSYAIADTGSTDDTPKLIREFFKSKGIPGVLDFTEFVNFEQARNFALSTARGRAPDYDYLLFCDADMELVVEDKDFLNKLDAPSYAVAQSNSGMSYWNTRLVRKDQTGVYRGVTHECFDAPSYTQLHGVHYKDHADGGNRADKFKRDIALLEGEVKNTDRSWFYLAQSLRDDGQLRKAADAYHTRASMGGWDEEVWCAQLNYARLMLRLGDEGAFILEMLEAYNRRPTRAEPLYDLANFYRKKGMNGAALMYAEAGLATPRPNDVLFVEDYAYDTGLREEFSITAFYNPAKRERGFVACNQLAMDEKGTPGSRDLARSNMFHYVQPIITHVPSFKPKLIDFTPPKGYRTMNPSITRSKNRLVANIRCVNYTITDDGRYEILAEDGSITDSNPIHTRNFLVHLNDDLTISSYAEILPPHDMPAPKYKLVIGFEDLRLFQHDGELYATACVREVNEGGWCEQILARVMKDGNEYRLAGMMRLKPNQPIHEKNWMPVVNGTDPWRFVYNINELVDNTCRLITRHHIPAVVDQIRGGTQVIRFNLGWLALVHESRNRPDGQRYYQHRFVWFDHELVPRRLTLPFVFEDRQIEFAAGLTLSPNGDKVIVSYGTKDREAWFATMTVEDVKNFIWKQIG